MALLPGTRLGPYEIGAALGPGGMGEVYRARDTRLERTVAIKILPEQLSGDPFDVAHDGQRFIITPGSNLSPSPITVVTNWTAALKKK